MSRNLQGNSWNSLRDLPPEELTALLQAEINRETPDRCLVMEAVERLEEMERSSSGSKLLKASWERYEEKRDMLFQSAHSRRLRRRTLILVLILLLGLLVAPAVFGLECIFTLLGRWTEDTFHFETPGVASAISYSDNRCYSDHTGLDQLRDAVSDGDISDLMLPGWLPEGYALVEYKTRSVNDGSWVYVMFSNGEHRIVYSVQQKNSSPKTTYTKDETDVSVYELDGISYYLVNNYSEQYAFWCQDNNEYMVSATDPELDLYKILRSLEKS